MMESSAVWEESSSVHQHVKFERCVPRLVCILYRYKLLSHPFVNIITYHEFSRKSRDTKLQIIMY
jgi:hypothetical protein